MHGRRGSGSVWSPRGRRGSCLHYSRRVADDANAQANFRRLSRRSRNRAADPPGPLRLHCRAPATARLPPKAKGADPNRARRGATYPSEFIPEWRAKSFWNAERDQIGMLGQIIADSRATSPGIRIIARRLAIVSPEAPPSQQFPGSRAANQLRKYSRLDSLRTRMWAHGG